MPVGSSSRVTVDLVTGEGDEAPPAPPNRAFAVRRDEDHALGVFSSSRIPTWSGTLGPFETRHFFFLLHGVRPSYPLMMQITCSPRDLYPACDI